MTEAPTFVREYRRGGRRARVERRVVLGRAKEKNGLDESAGLFAPSLKPLIGGGGPGAAAAALRARSLECLALLGCEAGIDVFGRDAAEPYKS